VQAVPRANTQLRRAVFIEIAARLSLDRQAGRHLLQNVTYMSIVKWLTSRKAWASLQREMSDARVTIDW